MGDEDKKSKKVHQKVKARPRNRQRNPKKVTMD